VSHFEAFWDLRQNQKSMEWLDVLLTCVVWFIFLNLFKKY
jgi:arginine exporter protein ArgO